MMKAQYLTRKLERARGMIRAWIFGESEQPSVDIQKSDEMEAAIQLITIEFGEAAGADFRRRLYLTAANCIPKGADPSQYRVQYVGPPTMFVSWRK